MAGIIFSEGSGVNDGVFGKVQAPVRMIIEKRTEQFEAGSVLKKVFTVERSKHALENYREMTSMGDFKIAGENGNHPTVEWREGYNKTITNLTWKSRFVISREIIDDGNTIELKKRPAAFAVSYERTREKYSAAALGNSILGNTSFDWNGVANDIKCFDGLALFNSAHTAINTSTTQSNIFSDIISADNIGKMETKMQNFTDNDDNILDVAPDTIIIPNVADLKNALFAAIGSDKDPATANNGFNYQFGRWNIIVWPYLNAYVTGSNTPWIMMDSQYNADNLCAIWQDRVPLEVSSHLDDDTNANVWDGYARFAAGFTDWRAFCLGGITTASVM